MTDLTLTHEATPQTPKPAPAGEYPLSTLSLRLEVDGVSLSWTLRGDDSDVASRLPRVLDYIKRLQAKLPKSEAPAETPRPQAVPSRETGALPQAGGSDPREIHDCQWHGPMKWSTKVPGTQYCSHKMADGSYCKEKWPKRAGEQSA